MVVTGVNENVGRVRVTTGVISGTSFIIGDNLSVITEGSSDHKKILKLYGNKDVIKLAKLGLMFKPTSNIIFDKCADTYYCINDGYLYVAIFNFSESKDIVYNFADIVGDQKELASTAKELWSGKTYDVEDGYINFSISSENAAIFKISLDGSEATPTPDNTAVETTTPSPTAKDTNIPDETVSIPTDDNTNTPKTESNDENDNSSTIILIVVVVAIVVLTGIAGVIIMTKKKQ